MFNNLWSKRKHLFKGEDTRFMLSTGFKFLGISFFVSFLIMYYLFQNIRLNYFFLKTVGFSGIVDLKNAYYDYILTGFIENLSYIMMIYIFIFFLGIYLGRMLLRPFKNIGLYCEEVLENPEAEYKVDYFSDYRLLTRFSENFFDYLRNSRKENKLEAFDVKKEFMGVHKPVLDKLFLFHFGFFLVIILLLSIWMITSQAVNIYENILQIGLKMTKSTQYKSLFDFIGDQSFVMDELYLMTIILMTLFYLILAVHLYMKVSGAAFGIFSTMRSFAKGNHFARVHLVGYSYTREHTRALNKYLDFMQKKYSRADKS